MQNSHSRENVQFTPGELVSFFKTPQFRTALTIAGDETYQSHRETGFTVETDAYKNLRIPFVEVGKFDTMRGAKILQDIDGMGGDYYGILLNFHFHPDTDGVIGPSVTDLKLLYFDHLRPALLGIGEIHMNRDVDILLLGAIMRNLLPGKI